jgi:hypothetical protein
MLRLAVPSGLLAIATVTWGQEAVGPVGAVLTLEQAVVLALQNNRQVQTASREVGKKIDQAAAVRTSRLPAFNVYFLESYLLTPSNLPYGGPLWEPLCYAQIGGLSVATFIELLLGPVLHAVFVLDLKLAKWETTAERSYVGSTEAEA